MTKDERIKIIELSGELAEVQGDLQTIELLSERLKLKLNQIVEALAELGSKMIL